MTITNPSKKIRAEEEAVEGIDRLSTLPDHILTHILSFEDDPKSSIQTSVLAGRWRHLWKHVPRLFLNAKSFTVSTFSRMLTTLDLDECFLPCGSESELDPFANCPSLEKLVLCNSRLENDKCGFKITGPDLVTLLVYSLKCSKLELFAPKLKSFAYLDKWKSPKLFFLATPPIDHADFSMLHIPIRLVENNSEEMKEACFNMLQGLCNASSLELSSSVLKLLSKNLKALKDRCCSFTRLKSLKVHKYDIDKYPYRIPYQLISYFLQGFPINEEPYIEFV